MGNTGAHSPETAIATFVSEATFDSIPEGAIRRAERAFVDTVGVTLAGSTRGAGKRAIALAGSEAGEITLIGDTDESAQAPLLEAIFANATAGHGLDFDDTALDATDGHPSVPMVAPLLAIGERDTVSGTALLTAYVVGFETQAALCAPISPGHYESGWHATATLGTFGATAATASLLNLSPSETRHALNIAASMASGLKRNFGTETKPVHAGMAARNGVAAARLARAGIDADPTAISGKGGFFDLYTNDTAVDPSATHELGEEWMIRSTGIDIKKYACCYYTHAAIYGTIQLLADEDIDESSVEAVHISASRGAGDAVTYDDPKTPTQAKFSMPYLIGYAIVNGTVDLAAFERSALDDPAVEAVRQRITFDVDEDRPYDWYGSSIRLETTTGEVYRRAQERPPGTHAEPLSDAELREKFEMCAARVRTGNATEDLYARLDCLRDVTDIVELTDRL